MPLFSLLPSSSEIVNIVIIADNYCTTITTTTTTTIMESALREISSNLNRSEIDRIILYKKLVDDKLVQSTDETTRTVSDLKLFIAEVLINRTRTTDHDHDNTIDNNNNNNNNTSCNNNEQILNKSSIEIGEYVLEKLALQRQSNSSNTGQGTSGSAQQQQQQSSLSQSQVEEMSCIVREALSEKYAKMKQFAQAAQCLSKIDLESAIFKVDDGYKFTQVVKIASYYLENMDTAQAELYLKRAKFLSFACVDEKVMKKFKLCDAVISDSKGRFVEAGFGYLALCTTRTTTNNKEGDEVEDYFRNAAICAALSKDCFQKTKLIAKLVQQLNKGQQQQQQQQGGEVMMEDDEDENMSDAKNNIALLCILKSIQLGRIIDANSIKNELTKPHHLNAYVAMNLEHNLICVSKLYKSITLVELSRLLKVEEKEAERKAIELIVAKKFKGVIDQEIGLLTFETHLELEENQILSSLTERIHQTCDLIQKRDEKTVRTEA